MFTRLIIGDQKKEIRQTLILLGRNSRPKFLQYRKMPGVLIILAKTVPDHSVGWRRVHFMC